MAYLCLSGELLDGMPLEALAVEAPFIPAGYEWLIPPWAFEVSGLFLHA